MPDTPDPLAVQVLTALDRAHARKRSPSEPWSSERKTLFTEVMSVVGPELDARDAQLERLSRGCGQHPGILGYRHPECGFCWHGKNGLDVPVSAPPREPICPRCTLVAIRKWAAGVGAPAVLAILDGTEEGGGRWLMSRP